MGADQQSFTPEEQEQLRKHYSTGHGARRWARRLFGVTPSDPRCKLCHAPFGGIGGKLFGLTPYSPSRKNPRFCKI